jgi:hypothetical protein
MTAWRRCHDSIFIPSPLVASPASDLLIQPLEIPDAGFGCVLLAVGATAARLTADYMSEFGLRRIKPPMEIVEADFAKIQKAIQKMMKGMSKEAYKDFAAEIVDDLDEFLSQRDQTKQ